MLCGGCSTSRGRPPEFGDVAVRMERQLAWHLMKLAEAYGNTAAFHATCDDKGNDTAYNG